MNWLVIALLAQFILGTAAVFDKFLLKKSYPNPLGYTFWIGILGLVALLLIPFGFENTSFPLVALALLAGAIFTAAMLLYFWALFYGEASGTVVAIGGLSPIATLLFSFLLLGTFLTPHEETAFFVLILGALFLALVAEKGTRLRVAVLVLAASVLFGISNVLAKAVFNETTFITGFVWIKIGGVLAALLFLLHAPWRAKIFYPASRNEFHNKAGYIANRAYAGVGSFLIYYAISLGVPPLVDAMQGVRFLFVFLGGWLLLRERFHGKILWGKIFAFLLISLGILVLGVGEYLRRTAPDPLRPIEWGVTFSQKFSGKFDFGDNSDWQDNYDAIIHDLGARKLRLIAYWDIIEPDNNTFDFSGLDYQMRAAEEVGSEIILVVGKKVPRWPECHVPRWAQDMEQEKHNAELLEFIEEVVMRYKDSTVLRYWQAENEPFLPFGEGPCALTEKKLLDREIALIRSLDSRHPILATDSGEIGLWFRAAKRGDVFGTTMYRRVHQDTLGNFEYPLPPEFFRIKEKITRFLVRDYEKKFIVIELGAEPWLKRQLYETTPEEQFVFFDFEFFKDTIDYAKATGFDEYYLWGAEWWYWLKMKHGDPRFWNEAKRLLDLSPSLP